MRKVDDGDPFNAGWNACLLEVEERVKKLRAVQVADDRYTALIPKAEVLRLVRGPKVITNVG